MDISKRLTWVSYLSYMLVGIVFISQGILILYVSKTYNMSLAHVGYLLFIPSLIQAFSTYCNGYFLEKANLKIQINMALLALCLGILFIISGFLPLFIIGLILVGFGDGMLISTPSYIIVILHPDKKFEKLNFINFFFSLGGIAGPLVLGQMLNLNIPWQIATSTILIIIVFLFLMNQKIKYSNFSPSSKTDNNQEEKIKWNFSVYLIAAALFFYVLSECVFSAWIVAYFKESCHFSIGKASMSLTIFWIFITFGRFSSDKIAKFMKLHHFIIFSSLVAFVAYLLVFIVKDTSFDLVMIAIMGVGYAGLYASILSYGIDQLPYTCPKLMSFIVLCGAAGGVFAIPLSSFFVNHFGLLSGLLVGLAILGLVILCIVGTTKDKRNKVKDSKSSKDFQVLYRYSRCYTNKVLNDISDYNNSRAIPPGCTMK